MILPDGRGHHELVVHVPADRARVRLDRHGLQAQSAIHAQVSLVDALVGDTHVLAVHIERVAVGHDELTGAHQAEPRSRLVTELGLDLVDEGWQAPVAREVRPDGGDDRLLVRRTEHQGAELRIHPHEHVVHGDVATGLLPELHRVQRRKEQLVAARAVELLGHDRADALEDPKAEGQQAPDPTRQRPHVATAYEQTVRGDLGVAWVLPLGGEDEVGGAHGAQG